MARPKTAKPLSTRVLVEIARDMTSTIPQVVWQHEIPILEAIFGEGKVKPVDPTTLDEGYSAKTARAQLVYNQTQDQIKPPSQTQGIGYVFIGDPGLEYQRLEAAYGKHADKDVTVVEYVYGRLQDRRFSEAVSGAALEDLPPAQLIEIIKQHGYLPPEPSFSASDETKERSVNARKALEAAKPEELVKIAEEFGVEIA